MLRVVVVMLLSAAASAGGQVLIRRGMQSVGSLEVYRPGELAAYFGGALLNPWVICGTGLQALAFFLFMTGLSWKDVTVVGPFTAVEYFFVAVLAIFLLNEAVSPLRWLGIAFVIVGVMLVSWSGADAANLR